MQWTDAQRTLADFRARALDAVRGGSGRIVLGRREIADMLEALGLVADRLADAGVPAELDDAMILLADALASGNGERIRRAATGAVVAWKRVRDERGRTSGPVPERVDLDAGGFRG